MLSSMWLADPYVGPLHSRAVAWYAKGKRKPLAPTLGEATKRTLAASHAAPDESLSIYAPYAHCINV